MPAGRTVDDLYDFAQSILTAARTSLEQDSIAPPEHRYVSHEAPDLVCCDTLAVRHLDPRFRLSTNRPDCVILWTGRVELTVARCVTVFTRDGELPPVATIEADAKAVWADRWAISRHLLANWHCSDPDLPCGEPAIETVIPFNVGDCSGTYFTVQLVLP